LLYFDLALSFLALFSLCIFLTLKAQLHSALAPLVSLASISIWFTIAGVLDVLKPAGWVLYLVLYALGIGTVASCHKKEDIKKLATPGAIVFWILAVFFAVIFPSASRCSASLTSSAFGEPLLK